MLSVLDIFRIGIGPSSSHTVGPMRISAMFIQALKRSAKLDQTARIHIELQGSLALTGVGHGTPRAAILGLMGHRPETFDPAKGDAQLERLEKAGLMPLAGKREIAFDMRGDVDLAGHIVPALHPNGMRMRAFAADGAMLSDRTYYSTGGGFVATQRQLEKPPKNDRILAGNPVPFPFGSAAELLQLCVDKSQRIDQLVLSNEDAMRPREKTISGIDVIAKAMDDCIARGLKQTGILPGGLKVRRRAPELWDKLQAAPQSNEREQLFDWLNCFAMAVNEENAAGGKVVTAPTNGAAGILPAVMRFYCINAEERACTDSRRKFLLTAGAIGLLYKQRASISGAEMGCQGEVGVACSMAAGGLAALWGGSPTQVASAAEIGMEHNLGLTCDPVGGLVQVPCIERNAIGAVKAVNAARLALHRDEATLVSLDQVIETMRQTGLDMSTKYKETSQGGLAVNVIEC
ncbi:L-serine ammonia-lyase [Pontixanthobacter gangjinensis]|uniref:L-serine dehydratase n=1 Tax=Pontixanthobacter gangjinensis TaxID=1028742 RepID=A0A6I4SMB4_9SPHN|nr:L-serine ammonia-lyase [Pontixanthobacter gangjinensis]MXO55967.1 L-serine ammonia-lyase [Pontixanthobacter gangjinensis]